MSPSLPKLAPTRLKGPKLQELRWRCLVRDKGICQDCGILVNPFAPPEWPNSYHMAHIKSRGAGGSDHLSNIRVLCGQCHGREHNGGKPCKEKQ